MTKNKYIDRATGEVLNHYSRLYKVKNMALLTDETLPANAKVIAYYMLSAGNHGIWRGTQKHLADKLHINVGNISKHIRLLRDKGYILDIEINGLAAYKVNPSIGE